MNRINQYTWVIIIVMLLQSCNSSTIQNDCVKFYSSKIHEICLPQLDSLFECSDDEMIKEALITINGDDNDIIGFYMPESNYQNIDTILSINYDNYVQVSLHKKFKKSKISFSTYMDFVKIMNENLFTEHWDKIDKKLKEKNLKLELNKPVVAKKYNYSKNINSIAMISKIDGFDYNILTMMNMIYLNKTLLIVGYYKHYDRKKTIEEAEKINEKIINKIVGSN